MSTLSKISRVALLVLLLGVVASAPVYAGSAVIGSVAGTMNATVGGQALLPNTTIFSGDSLQVRDGVAVVAVGNGSRMVFGRDTVASFLRDTNEVTVVLTQGNVSVFHPNQNVALRVKAGDVSVAPAAGFKTLGDVAMVNNSVVITAKEGSLRVEDGGTTKNVAKGQTIVLTPKTAQHAGGGASWGGGGTALGVAAVGAGATAAILAGIGMSRANDAKTAAQQAITAANQANATAATANTSAQAAVTAANTANTTAAAALLQSQCIYDLILTNSTTSPIVIPAGSCKNH